MATPSPPYLVRASGAGADAKQTARRPRSGREAPKALGGAQRPLGAGPQERRGRGMEHDRPALAAPEAIVNSFIVSRSPQLLQALPFS
jgi:hypothetical protein